MQCHQNHMIEKIYKLIFAFLLLLLQFGCNGIDDTRINISYGAWNIDDRGVDDVNIGGWYKKKHLKN